MITTDSKERKDVPVHSGCLAYFPDALAEVARLSQVGNDKHNPGQPLHWSRDKSNDHLDCLARHLMECGTLDTDSVYHDVKVAWRALANLQILLEQDADAKRVTREETDYYIPAGCDTAVAVGRGRLAGETDDEYFMWLGGGDSGNLIPVELNEDALERVAIDKAKQVDDQGVKTYFLRSPAGAIVDGDELVIENTGEIGQGW